jgi:HPt (histidine-containing phosphotransfer) domain-containing protein
MDIGELAGKIGLEEEEFLELVEIFVEKSKSDISNFQSAFDKGDIEQVVEAAHSIKGAAGNLGFREIFEIANGIEMDARQNIMEGAPKAVQLIKEKIDLIGARLVK